MIALIPAYNPSEELIPFVRELADSDFTAVLVVNDGSSRTCNSIFCEIATIEKVTLLRHAVNLGKGAALKTGLNHSYCYFQEHVGVVTLDADGQHLVIDTLNVARMLKEQPASLVMGAREFDKDVPLRSKFGNSATRSLFRLLTGQKLNDTQSGLRGIPMDFIPSLLKIDSNGYEFELDMLLACKYTGRKIVEHEIQTVYIEGNKSSHFNPLIDSMKIYFVLFRFMLASSFTAVIDYSVFFLVYVFSSNLIASQVSSRIVAMFFNYSAVKKLVFYSEHKHNKTFPKYATLVFLSGSLSYALIKLLIDFTGMSIMPAKILSELIIFLANFTIQRDLIFTNNKKLVSTDWDHYYSRPYKTATYTRKYTESVLHQLINKYSSTRGNDLLIGELGGANSCFFDGIKKEIKPSEYYVIDNNSLGLEKFRNRIGNDTSVVMYNEDVLSMDHNLALDVVFSVGLIEHFNIDDTKKAIAAHFKLLKPEGIAIISFPTPTFLYKSSRYLAEICGLWIFHDERPLKREDVAAVLVDNGTILYEKVLWPIFFTQRIMVIKKKAGSQINPLQLNE